MCLGQHPARRELEIVLPTLLLRLVLPAEEVPRGDRQGVYGVRELMVRW